MNSTQWLRQQAEARRMHRMQALLVGFATCLPATVRQRQQQLLPIVRCCLGLRRKCYSPLHYPSLSLCPSLARLLSSLERVVVCSGSVNVKFDSHLGMHVLYSRVWSGVQQGGEGRGESTQICCAYVHWSLLPFPFLALSFSHSHTQLNSLRLFLAVCAFKMIASFSLARPKIAC